MTRNQKSKEGHLRRGGKEDSGVEKVIEEHREVDRGEETGR